MNTNRSKIDVLEARIQKLALKAKLATAICLALFLLFPVTMLLGAKSASSNNSEQDRRTLREDVDMLILAAKKTKGSITKLEKKTQTISVARGVTSFSSSVLINNGWLKFKEGPCQLEIRARGNGVGKIGLLRHRYKGQLGNMDFDTRYNR